MKRQVMPQTAAQMARKNLKANDKRYAGKRLEQSETRRKAILKREARLNKLGWSLLYFD